MSNLFISKLLICPQNGITLIMFPHTGRNPALNVFKNKQLWSHTESIHAQKRRRQFLSPAAFFHLQVNIYFKQS